MSTTPKKKHYVTNEELLREIKASKVNLKANPELRASAMTDRLVELLMLMVDKYATKPNWSGYSYVEEFKADALFHLCNKWDKFDETRGSNPFSYYTQIIYNCFIGSWQKEKKVQKIRDSLLEKQGMSPSFGRQVDTSMGISDGNVPTESQGD